MHTRGGDHTSQHSCFSRESPVFHTHLWPPSHFVISPKKLPQFVWPKPHYMNNRINILFQGCPVARSCMKHIDTSYKFQPICDLNLAPYNPVVRSIILLILWLPHLKYCSDVVFQDIHQVFVFKTLLYVGLTSYASHPTPPLLISNLDLVTEVRTLITALVC